MSPNAVSGVQNAAKICLQLGLCPKPTGNLTFLPRLPLLQLLFVVIACGFVWKISLQFWKNLENP